MSSRLHSAMRLYSDRSERLYLNPSERISFLEQTRREEPQTRLLCLILFYTGCRLSEALNLRWEDIQFEERIIAIKSLKKRDQHHMRELPIPTELVTAFAQMDQNNSPFTHDRTTGWRRIGRVMEHSGITGIHATPKGLRHSFAMYCVYQSIPITLCQKWMGHADIRTTAIYYQIVGREEREMAGRLWG